MPRLYALFYKNSEKFQKAIDFLLNLVYNDFCQNMSDNSFVINLFGGVLLYEKTDPRKDPDIDPEPDLSCHDDRDHDLQLHESVRGSGQYERRRAEHNGRDDGEAFRRWNGGNSGDD